MGSFIPRDQLWGVLVKLAPWGVAHCNSLRPGRRCLARTESSTAVRGIARAPLAARPWVAGGINAPNAPYRPRLSLAFNECMQENWKFRAGAIIRVRSKVAILRNKTNTETKLVGHYSPSPRRQA